VSFLQPVFIGDRLKVSGAITYLNDSYRQVQISAQIVNEQGSKVSRAKIKAGVLSHEPADHRLLV